MILFSVSVSRILAAEVVDDDVQVLLGAEALALQDFYESGNLPHVGNRRFFEEHAFAFRALVVPLVICACD